MKELIGNVSIYNEGGVIGVDAVAEETGRVEDMLDHLHDMGHRTTVMDVDLIDIDETAHYFSVEPPLTREGQQQLAQFCIGTLDDDKPGGLSRPTRVSRWTAPLRYVDESGEEKLSAQR